MWDKILGNWIEKHLGTYFKDLDVQKFRLDLGKGDLKLGPLELRPEAFLHSENAVEIRAGYVGSLSISFPKLMEITSAPLTVELDSVLVLVGLTMRKQERGEQQKEDEAKARRARHQAAIAAAEQLLQSLQTASGFESIAAAAGLKKTAAFLREDSFMTRQILRLADNLRWRRPQPRATDAPHHPRPLGAGCTCETCTSSWMTARSFR